MSKQIQSLEQKQSLIMTVGMHQSIKILQMSSVELSEFAISELDKNPFLEDATVSIEVYEDKKSKNKNKEKKKKKKDDNYLSTIKPKTKSNANQEILENITKQITLKEHLNDQIHLVISDNREYLIAKFLIDYIHPSGYLAIKLTEIPKILKCHIEEISNVLIKLQKLDPVGVFARDLKECLIIQAIEIYPENMALLEIINNIELVSIGEMKKLAKIVELSSDELTNQIKILKTLNPKPGNGFLDEQTMYKIPDVIMSFDPKGDVKLEINPEAMPRLRTAEDYYIRVRDRVNTKEEKAFTQKEMENANLIVKSIEHRGLTILKIAKIIVEEQIEFFQKGIMYLKPMTLNHIALKAGFNESTVSRATAHKYISTPVGIYELKYFFSSSLSNTKIKGEDVSSTKVKELIKQIILSEGSDKILSDEDIASLLKSFNVNIARRTVAKYRESLSIQTSAIRKRQKARGLMVQ